MKAITAIFGLLGAAMLAGAIYWIVDTHRFLDQAILAQGVVVALDESWSQDSVTYAPIVVFQTRDGDEFEFRSSVSSNPPSYHEGEQVDVFYLPGSPHEARINSFFSVWGGPFIVGFIGLIFFAFGFGSVLFGALRGRTEARLREHGTCIDAEVVDVERRGYTVNGVHPWRILAKWRDPKSGKEYRFKSANVWSNPSGLIEKGKVPVWIDPSNPAKKHFIDLTFLPESILTLR